MKYTDEQVKFLTETSNNVLDFLRGEMNLHPTIIGENGVMCYLAIIMSLSTNCVLALHHHLGISKEQTLNNFIDNLKLSINHIENIENEEKNE